MTPPAATLRVYADHNATSPLRPEVLALVCETLASVHGNASSLHHEGAGARRLVSEARRRVADLAGVASSGVVFTSGGTEANNLAITGSVRALRWEGRGRPPAVAVGAGDHHSALRSAEALEAEGIDVRRIELDGDGVVTPAALERALTGGGAPVVLVSLAWANNETGVVQDVPALARIAHARGARLHVDAVQAAGRVDVDLEAAGADLASLSAHKLGGPKGVGALVVRGEAALLPILHGGGQERGRRSGTLDVPAIAGFGEACRLAAGARPAHVRALAALTERFEAGLAERFPHVAIHGARARRVPGTTCLGVLGAESEPLLIALDLAGVAASAGAACTTGAVEPSHVLAAMGVEPRLAAGTLRVSFGWSNVPADVERVLDALVEVVSKVVTA